MELANFRIKKSPLYSGLFLILKLAKKEKASWQ
jgi:hypothetical protein